jgi:hypothetical protein
MWFRDQAFKCPKGYGMSLALSPTDTTDLYKVVTAGVLWDQRTKKRRVEK